MLFRLEFTQNGRFSQKQSLRDTIRVSNSLDPDQDQCIVMVQTVYKGYQQAALADKQVYAS